MKFSYVLFFLAGAFGASLLMPIASAWQQPDANKEADAMAAMMDKAKRFTQPGKQHKLLERLLGKWNTETRFFLGEKPTPPEKGTAEFAWLMKDRWLKGDWSGTMMRRPVQGFMMMGYDNYKMSYVMTAVSNLDTAMTRTEGRTDQSGKVLLTYGTIDEYLTGEHDKMAKYVWRFLSEDKIVLEIHDLAIGEVNTKVVEITYLRQS
jgi:hypothetical protein